jgi:DNA invertase Pin-like site-specific DNA recombinase
MEEPCAKVLAAVYQFRRSLYSERVVSGLASARAKGVSLGRPKTLKWRRDDVLELRRQGKGIRQIARELRMPPASVFKLIKEAK